ncbi:hypothetical protein [Halolamina salifodinae]|uniref:Xanthosine utilization system XapX-like protein n=1 Tax=Halolamina salifodinae TaxID=1202767 RepID=A0A8T4GYN9_9EURY|nr:hypothetical protein [Halolamina salifodinae]MBP1988127.1 xanthosine utilization system XapX-like protein [Halolamina salifodinae]
MTVGALLLVGALFVLLAVGYRRENTAAVANTATAIAVTLVPRTVGWALGVDSEAAGISALTFWIAVASVLHCLGMLGRYESVSWWDHLTHALSASLAAALLYAWLLVSGPERVASTTVIAGTLLGILALSVLWEIGELLAREVARRYGIEPVLVHYGWRDTAFDLLFDIVGAALVVTLDLRLFVPTVESIVRAI